MIDEENKAGILTLLAAWWHLQNIPELNVHFNSIQGHVSVGILFFLNCNTESAS